MASLGAVSVLLLLCALGYAPLARRDVPSHVPARVLVAVLVLAGTDDAPLSPQGLFVTILKCFGNV